MYKDYFREKRQELWAYLFGTSFLTMLVLCAGMAFFSAGPIILGTEMNANGTVEYLCLGRSCETYQAMDW